MTAIEELRDACTDLLYMLGPDRCIRCAEVCYKEESGTCALEERLVRLGVEVPEARDRVFVSQCAEEDELMEANAKLRELACGLLTGYECGHGELCEGCSWDGVGDDEFRCPVREEARELGVEVEE